jgi:hypothetical protein
MGRISQQSRNHVPPTSSSVSPILSPVRQPVESRLEIGPIGPADIIRKTFPVTNLPFREILSLLLG